MITDNILLSPKAIPTDRGQKLRIEFDHWEVSTIDLTVRIRQLHKNGEYIETLERPRIRTGETNRVFFYNLTDGYLISVSVDADGSSLPVGVIYCKIGIQYGDVDSNVNVLKLTSGYIADGLFVGYPDTLPQSFITRDVAPRSVVGTDPAAGAEIAEAWATPMLMKFISVQATLITNATVANRRVRFRFTSSGAVLYDMKSRTDQTAGQTVTYLGWYGDNMPADDTVNGFFYIPLPDVLQGIDFTFDTLTLNLQAGDNWGMPRFEVLPNVQP